VAETCRSWPQDVAGLGRHGDLDTALPTGSVDFHTTCSETLLPVPSSVLLEHARRPEVVTAMREFYAEADRVLAPGGLLAAWCYAGITITPEIDAEIAGLYGPTLGAFWPPERILVEEGYRGIEFPYPEIVLPHFEILQPLTLPGLAGYLNSWSATERYKAAHPGADPVLPVIERIAVLWGPPETLRPARWPLAVRAGHRPG